jgi:hypothetical protein
VNEQVMFFFNSNLDIVEIFSSCFSLHTNNSPCLLSLLCLRWCVFFERVYCAFVSLLWDLLIIYFW